MRTSACMCCVRVVAGAQQGSERADSGSGNLQLLIQRPDSSHPAAPLATTSCVHRAAVQGITKIGHTAADVNRDG